MSEAQLYVLMILIGITILVFLEYTSTKRSRQSKRLVTFSNYEYDDLKTLRPNPGTYPDDPDSLFAQLRAWDRHLALQNMLPIGTCNLEEVGPILVDPNGDHRYLVFSYTGAGHLTLGYQTLLQTNVRKASRST